MENVREEIEKIVFGYLDLSERAQDPGKVIDKITSLITDKEPSAQSPAAMAGSATLVGFSKEEIKAMVDSVYGSVEWVWTEKGGRDVLVCYPNATGEVFIYDKS